jgi:hypothetical protein
MQRSGPIEAAANLLRKVFPVVLLPCLAVFGCGKTCFSGGLLKGSTSGITVSNSSCPLTKAMGAVIVQISAASAPPTASSSFPPPFASPHPSPGASPSNVQHIFVTLRGIEAHPDMVADTDSPDWQELAPNLLAHPVQLDLLAPLTPLAPLTTIGDSGSMGLPAGVLPATVPADEYRQLRLRLLPRNSSPDDLIPESNACGDVGWNCIVFADRSARPLEFNGAAPEFHIPLEHGSVFRVLPDELIQLSIDFDAASSVYFASNAAVRLVPVFSVLSRRPISSSAASPRTPTANTAAATNVSPSTKVFFFIAAVAPFPNKRV